MLKKIVIVLMSLVFFVAAPAFAQTETGVAQDAPTCPCMAKGAEVCSCGMDCPCMAKGAGECSCMKDCPCAKSCPCGKKGKKGCGCRKAKKTAPVEPKVN